MSGTIPWSSSIWGYEYDRNLQVGEADRMQGEERGMPEKREGP